MVLNYIYAVVIIHLFTFWAWTWKGNFHLKCLYVF